MGYITEARVRAGRRKSRWNLLLIPAYLLPWSSLTLGLAVVFSRLYRSVHPGSQFAILPDTIGGVLIAVGSLFACLGPAMVLANQIVATVPAARAALDAEASVTAGTTRHAANRALGRLSYMLTPAALVLALLGVFVVN